MDERLRVLLVEDCDADAVLLVEELKSAGFKVECRRVDEEPDFRAQLGNDLDLIISDFSLPRFSGPRALEIVRESQIDLPFIIISGTIGEERAVEILKAGATDYLLKGRLHRIGQIVRRALSETSLRKEHKRLEEQLRLQATALANAANAIAITDAKGCYEWVNPAFSKLTGYSWAELAGKNPRILKSTRHSKEFYQELWKTVLAGRTWSGEITNLRKDGTPFIGEQTISPVFSVAGEISHFVGIATDVTEKKKLESQLLRAQRMESIGTLAGGIAHDLNNALAPILMSIDLLKRDFYDHPNIATTLDLVATSAQRGADMVKQLLTFSRGIEGKHGIVELKHLVREMQTIMRQTFPKNIKNRVDVGKGIWTVDGDVTQLHQVLLNLCVNARDAMPQGGNLTINLSNIVVDEPLAVMSVDAKPGPYVVVSVADTGIGIPPEVKDRIFEPFFTTKPVDKGTGLGLSTVSGIVKSHNGFITVYSEVNKGSEFKVYLPARASSAEKRGPAVALELPTGKGELVLVVDDEQAIRHLTQRTLEAYGYNVLTASDGAQAIALCARQMENIAVVLTDIAMPIMDGAATIRALQTLKPDFKIIAASGLQDSQFASNPDSLGASAFIHKPFTAEQLLKVLRAVLDGK